MHDDGLELDGPSCGGDAEKLARMGAGDPSKHSHDIFGDVEIVHGEDHVAHALPVAVYQAAQSVLVHSLRPRSKAESGPVLGEQAHHLGIVLGV
ncbi:hypothetical protein jaqu_31040 [Jannaschia aquimarina]|uniref:Uncharacterized protein n=1 Tax=Jannaschia aquimarina TaxID=935700 RepID=A0A0D1CKA1_9RHOB|nr:hypothetical protein jaqu_31040 [Jannaschia aquimarina]